MEETEMDEKSSSSHRKRKHESHVLLLKLSCFTSMATGAPSSLASSSEKTNGNKLSRLLIDGGTTILRNIFDHYHPPGNLASDLNSNYSILNKLLRKRVLNGHQWDKLFPPGGGPPDSNTFDITLLFLLLTNICGLSPPLTGWHTKPSPGDNSLEANLARVKFFRNELYGHVTSTAFDAAIFSSLWQEISAALLYLGLDQAEIERLKAESGGEEDYLDALFEWADSDVEIKTELKDIRQSQAKIQEVLQLKEDRRKEDKENEVLKKLAVVDTKKVIQTHLDKYQEGTRISVFEKIELWLNDRTSKNRVMVISGDAGMGKSVISAVVCQRMRHAGRLTGGHFCQHNKARPRNPKIMLQSLAYQLSDFLLPYKRELVKALSRNLGEDINNLEVGELFELLFEEPLINIDDPGRSLLMVIDGLDESEYKGRNELLDVMANQFSTLPGWVRFCVTTRPEINIADRLKKFNPVLLEQDDEENVEDIRLFLERQLCSVIQSGFEDVVIDALVRKAAGHFLYAYLMVDFIKKNNLLLTPEELGRILPSGVSSVYQSYFERLENELKIGEDQFLTFLSALAAAREPLPLDFVSNMLISDSKSPSGHRKVRKAIDSISTLLPVHDDCIVFFHKSVKDWLTDRTAYGRHDFSVDEKHGHVMLSQLCTDELSNVKRKGVHGTEFGDIARYALQHGVCHMVESEKLEEGTRSFEEIVNNYVTDLDIVYAKLCVNDTASSEDIILCQKQEAFQLLNSESQNALRTLLFLLRKYHERLSTNPTVFLQVMVNEGGDVFAGKATELLQNRYHEIPYMEYVHKGADEKQIGIQVPFPCSSQVACFDISPQQEFMVCECRDGTIQLWSLETGNQKWKRPVIVEKVYFDGHGAFREVLNSPVLSCYRSVVFHPTKPIVLPGVLSHAYSFDGDFLPLFSKSNCRFSVCSVNADSMITDCPKDAKCLVMWSLETGGEITRNNRGEVVLSFAWSPDRKLLAISHLSRLVCLVDALNCFETLAEVTTFLPCGMIKFAPNLKFLFCWCKPVKSMWERYPKGIRLDIMKLPCGTFSFNVVNDNVDYEPWDYELSSKAGFLMGDPVSCLFRRFQDILGPYWTLVEGAFAFVLGKQSVLRVFPGNNRIAMFSPDEMKITRTISCKRLGHVAFAVDGKSVYGVTVDKEAAVVSFDVLSGKRKSKIEISTCRDLHYPKPPFRAVNVSDNGICLVPVTDGVLVKQRYRRTALQLWNFELSQQVQRWPRLSEVTYMMPVTDQCVACVGKEFEVSILDTSSGEIVKTISLCHEGYQSTYPLLDKEAIVCNSKYQLLSTDRHSVQLSDSTSILWKRVFEDSELLYSWNIPGIFSPAEEFVLISVKTSQNWQDVHVLDASSGATLRILCTVDEVMRYAFVSDTECVMHCGNHRISESLCLQLFSVKTGDLLSVLDMDYRPLWLASFPKKGLIAIGLWQSKRMCAFIKVRMPRDKDNREAKERSSDDDDDHFQSKKEDDENKDDKGDEFDDNDDSHNSDGVQVGGDDVGDDNGGGDEIIEEQELLQKIQELSLEDQVEDLDESDSVKIKIHEGTITSEGTYWALKRGSAHVFFPPNAVSQPTSIVAHRWKCSARSPPLQEHESVVSNVIEISTTTGHELKFDTKAKLVLSHSAPDLQGYELVIKKLIDWESNEWEEVDGTKALQCLKAVEEDFPPRPRDVPEFFFPVAQADITECSTYAVVCRLKPSPAYTITSSGGSFSHPDYPRVTVTIPKNAVAPEAKIPLVLKVQEVPGEEFKDQDVFLGPILRVSCSQIVEFSKPVTIQLPVSLRSDQEKIPVPSTCRVRVLFLNSDGEDKKWMEITDGLKCPVNFDGTFVRFQVERFSGYTCVFEWYKEDFSVSGVITYLTSLIWKQPLLGVFFSYFTESDRAYSQDVLHLVCCPAHMRERVVQELENANVVPSEENSRKKLIPGHDKAFVFVSGGITPAEIEDMEDFHLMFESDNRDKKQLPVRLISDQVLSHVEFRSSPDPNAKNLLSRLNFRLSSMKLDLSKTPVEFFGVPLNDQTLLDADPNYVLSACRPFLSHDTYEEHFIHLNSGCRTPKQALRSLLQVVAGLDPNSQDGCFEAVVSALREASNEGFLHVIERLQEAHQKVNIALVDGSEVINKVSETVCSSWKRLARELQLRAGQIDNISEEEQDDEERCRKTLRTWCQLNGRNSTIRKLMISLTKIGKAEVNYDIMRCLHLVEPD